MGVIFFLSSQENINEQPLSEYVFAIFVTHKLYVGDYKT